MSKHIEEIAITLCICANPECSFSLYFKGTGKGGVQLENMLSDGGEQQVSIRGRVGTGCKERLKVGERKGAEETASQGSDPVVVGA